MNYVMEYELKQIEKAYSSHFDKKMTELEKAGVSDVGAREREAQKYAIKQTAIDFFLSAEPEYKRRVWNEIYAAHIARKAGITITPEQAEKVTSANQSWNKSSGHAFEEMVREVSNKALEGTGISVVLQREAKKLVTQGSVRNEVPDIEWLKPQMKSSVFDLFAMKDDMIFGCIQAKTSIRDRVTRDREPSLNAMNHFFWSVVFVLDGDFLKLPKFQKMVNGGSDEFLENGWHGLYAFSLPDKELNQRINLLDTELSVLKEHAVAAARDWFERRQWMNKDWMPRTGEVPGED